jgi:hypothetical protein
LNPIIDIRNGVWGNSSDYVGGNAGDMGEGVSSKLSEPFVGGVCPVGETLPMNQDCEDEDLIHVLHSNETKHTGTHPRSPPTSFTACFHVIN